MNRKRKIADESRVFQEKWTNLYLFVNIKEKPVCLVCRENLAVMKEYNLKRHYETKHAAKFDGIEGQMRVDKVEALKKQLQLQQYTFQRPNIESEACLKCWENCELLQSNFQVWGAMCEEKDICFPGCQQACKFHQEASSNGQQSQPVIHTKGEAVIHVNGARAQWPSQPLSADPNAPVVYVVMRKSQLGPWRQIIQTLDSGTRVPMDQGNSMLRVLVVDPQGLLTIYSPDEQSLRGNKKKKKTINTEIKATTSKSITSDEDTPWILKEVSLIHQKVLVIGEIAWEPKTTRGVYLVTWEVDGGGLKGNLFTDSTCVTLSLWPDTIYHIQVELVSRIPGVENLKSQMMDLDTGRAQKVSTETDVNILPDETPEEGDLNSPLLSVLFSAVRGEHVRQTYRRAELVMGICVAIVLFAIVLAIILWRWRNKGAIIDNIITGSTNLRGQKLVEDLSTYSDFHPIVTVLNTSVVEEPTATPEVLFQGHPSHFPSRLEKKSVQV